ncbi:MORN repeat-containing protein 5-like [Eurosta solidaginis]|uniref:MORN repeat-containing protein 5-like n=1 Tax=Eurosta solidaginis TaxID=178769 RepID=UPI003530CF5A
MQFITGSQFHGNYNPAIHCIDGFGSYIYPDGSEYKGNFKKGKFHGHGQIILSKPYSFTFVGIFEDGKLTEVHDMIYGDGLHLKATLDAQTIDFSNWKYCSEKDRRYAYEISGGLGPSGQGVFMRNLDANSYDTGGGIYKEDTEFIVKIPPPFFSIRFLACDKEKDWIIKNCRKGPCDRDAIVYSRIEPAPEIGRKILNANYLATEILNNCSCNQRYDRKLLRDELSESIEPSASDMPTSHSTSLSSFSENTLEITDLATKCRNEVRTLTLDLTEKQPGGEVEEELVRPSYVYQYFDNEDA